MNVRAKKRLGVLVALVVMMVLAGASAYLVRQQRRAARLVTARVEGLAAYAEQDWDLTLERLGYCVGKNMRDAPVHVAFADARRHVRIADGSHIRRAFLAAEIAIDIDPANREALSLLMELYAGVGFFTELTGTIDAVLELDPTDREALEFAVGMHKAQDELDEALQAADRLATVYPDDYAAQAIRIVAMHANNEPADDIDARLDDLERAFPDAVSAPLLRAIVLIDRGESAEAVQIVRVTSSAPFEDWSELGQFVNVADALSIEDPDLATIADETLKKYLDDPEMGADAARLTLARGFRWGRLDDANEYLEVISSAVSSVSDATLGWAAFTQAISSDQTDNPFADQLAERQSSAAEWWITIHSLAEAIKVKNTSQARELLQQLGDLSTEAEHRDPAVAAYLTALVEIESGEWRTAGPTLAQLGEGFGWRVARQTLARVLLDEGHPGEAYAVLLQYPGADGVLLAESLIQMGNADPDNTELKQVLQTLAGELEVAGQEDARLLLLAAQAHSVIGQTDEAIRLASVALDSSESFTMQQVLPVAARVALTNTAAAKALLERVSVEEASAYTYLWNLGDNVQNQELIDSLIARIDSSSDNEKLTLQRQLIDVYVRHERTEDAVTVMRQLSDEHEANAQVQAQILGAASSWSDEDLVNSAIDRLRVSAGSQATQWRIFNLRRAIVFNKDPNTRREAINSLADSIRGKTDDPRALAMLAEAILLQGDPGGAASYLSRAVAADARSPVYLVQLVEVLLQAGNVAEADRRLDDLANISTLSDEVRRARATLLARRGRQDEAVADLEALGTGKNPADLHTLGFMLVRQGDIDRAESIFDAMLELDGVSDQAIATVADFRAIRYSDLSRGEAVLARLRDRDSADVAILQGAFYERHGKVDQAEQLYKEAVQTDQSIATPAYAIFLLRQSRFGEARTMCEQNALLIAASTENAPVVSLLEGISKIAKICEELGADAEEVNAIVGALGDAGSTATLVQFAGALEELSRTRLTPQADYRRFIGELADIVDSDPSFFAAWRLRVWAESKDALRDGRTSTDALATARSAARTMRDDPRTAGLVVGVLMEAQQWDEAMFAAREWRDRSLADTFDPDFTIAAIHIIRREFADAFRALDPWWRDGDGDARISEAQLVIVASAMVGLGRIDDAHNVLWQPESAETDWAIRYLQLVELMGNRTSETRAWIARAENFLIPRNAGQLEVANSWYTLAAQTGIDADWEQVVRILTAVEPGGPAPGVVALMLASAHDNLGNDKEAESAYRAGLAINPDEIFAINNLAYLLSQQEGRTDEAIELGERSLQIAVERNVAPAERAVFLDTLGICYLRAGRFADAQTQFASAISADPSKGGAYVGIAEAALRLGQEQQASRHLAELDAFPAALAGLSEDERERLAAIRTELTDGSGHE